VAAIDNIGRIEGFEGWRVHVRTSAGTFDLPYLSTYRPQLDDTVTIVDGVVQGPVVESGPEN
jgi:hypothetical protein